MAHTKKFLQKYPVEELFDIVADARDVRDVANLYYVNAEAVERNSKLKATMLEKKNSFYAAKTAAPGKVLNIDIETFSSVDLAKCGVYKYVESSDFEILLLSYSFDGAPVMCVDLACGEDVPPVILSALTNPDILKTAHNANFERTCLAKFFGLEMNPAQWECTMVRAAMFGLPMSLDQVAKVLRLTVQKDTNGKALIRYFCVPCKPTKANGQRTRNLPEHDETKWQAFRQYNVKDVETEMAARHSLGTFTVPDAERSLWAIDQEINDRGVMLDPDMIRQAVTLDAAARVKLTAEAVKLTGLENPNSVAQIKAWLEEATGEEIESLNKKVVPTILKNCDDKIVRRVLEIRQEMSKTSVKKYVTMERAMCDDRRVRGLLQFCGAGRTWRWAGRLVQVQNLPKNELKDLDLAREIVCSGDLDLLEMTFGNVPDTLSQLVRTAFVAPAGCELGVADFSSIEAVIIAWMADETWRLDVFDKKVDVYSASAAQMFGVPVEEITKTSPLRQKGKIAELALGYQGGPNALVTMGALEKGLTEPELLPIVKAWRAANPHIVKLWYKAEEAAVEAVRSGEDVWLRKPADNMFRRTKLCKFFTSRNVLFCELPSGRRLAYVNPRISSQEVVKVKYLKPAPKKKIGDVATVFSVVADGMVKQGIVMKVGQPFEKHSLLFDGMDQTTKQWKVQTTYGGKLVENMVQAIARDCLAEALKRVHAAGYKIVMHVHDEIVAELPADVGSADEMCSLMALPMPWAEDLKLRAEGYETAYYKKD